MKEWVYGGWNSVMHVCVCNVNGEFCELCVCVCVCVQAKHAVEGNRTWGVDGDTGTLADMTELGVWDPLSVKVQTYKTAIEVCVECVCGVCVFVHVCVCLCMCACVCVFVHKCV